MHTYTHTPESTEPTWLLATDVVCGGRGVAGLVGVDHSSRHAGTLHGQQTRLAVPAVTLPVDWPAALVACATGTRRLCTVPGLGHAPGTRHRVTGHDGHFEKKKHFCFKNRNSLVRAK